MKKHKSNGKFRTILVIFIVSIIGAMVAWYFSNNNLLAAVPSICSKTDCGGKMEPVYNGTYGHYYVCGTCGLADPTNYPHQYNTNGDCICRAHQHEYEKKTSDTQHWDECKHCGDTQNLEAHNLTYKKLGNGTHHKACSICFYSKDENHSYGLGGNCACGDHQHEYEQETSDVQHWDECKHCGDTQNLEAHNFNYKDLEDGNHRKSCTICLFAKDEKHVYGADGLCECGAHTHKYEKKTSDIQHWDECKHCGDTQNLEAHNLTYKKLANGKHHKACSICLYFKDENHSYGLSGNCACGDHQHEYEQETSDVQHWDECKHCGDTQNLEAHNFNYKDLGDGNHRKSCTICLFAKDEKHVYGADESCPCGTHKHQRGEVIKAIPAEGTPNRHCLVWACAYPGCEEEIKENESIPCQGATHENGGKCELCERVYEKHELYKKWEDLGEGSPKDTHGLFEVCSVCNWRSREPIEMGKHTGGKHPEGICELCGAKYQTHEFEIIGYRYNYDGTHSNIYRCFNSDCGTIFGEPVPCSGATHPGGLCQICRGQYEKHETYIAYDGNGGYGNFAHAIVRYCNLEGCDYEERIDGEDCSGASHKNGGKCTLCGKKYQNHDPIGEPVKYKIIIEGHLALYKCSFEGCNELVEKRSNSFIDYVVWDSHEFEEYIDKENGTHTSVCTVCGYALNAEHNYEQGGGSASTYSLRRAAPVSDASCVECGALASAADNGCEHSYVEKYDEYQHWNECTKCKYLEEGTLKVHEYTEYKVNEDGTHSSNCTGCKYKLTEEHYYEDGACSECNTKVSQECEHSYKLQGDETNHWGQCTKCNNILSKTSEKHQFETYINNNDGKHTAYCKICAYKLIEEHPEDCDKCETVIVKPDDDNDDKEPEQDKDKDEGKVENKDENKEPEKDNTIIDSILPDTGASRIIVIVVIGLAIVVGITKFKLKKYKGI